MNITKRVGLYARVSTRNGQNPETQLIPLREYCQLRGFGIVDEYIDVGISGSKDRRPQLDRLMNDARHRKIDAVIVARFDRFARSTRHLVLALEEFSALGVDFVSMNENIDTSTPMGKMVFTIIAAVAELERSLIRERIYMGLDRARKQGKTLGRRKVIVDRAKIRECGAAGQSIKSIAKQHGIARATVRSILNRAVGVAKNRSEKTRNSN